jgi:hypothetical protein
LRRLRHRVIGGNGQLRIRHSIGCRRWRGRLPPILRSC